MSDILERDLISYDPLSEVTRKERTSLLGLSMLGLALVAVPLVPEKFGVFGIEFSKVNQKTFLALYALMVSYYLIAFLLYALTDFVAWRRLEHIRRTAYIRAQGGTDADVATELPRPPQPATNWLNREMNPVYRGFASFAAARLASRARAVFEFGLPIAFSLYVVIRLLRA